MLELLFELVCLGGPVIGSIAVGIIIGYGLLYFLPYHLMLFIQETSMSSQITMYHDQTIVIWILSIILVLLYSTPIFVHKIFNTFIKKILGIVLCVLPVLAFFTFIHSTSPENYVKNEFNEKYNQLNEANIYFKNSTVGKELRVAIDTNDYTTMNKYYPEGSREGVNEKVEGLSSNTMIDKLALINEIGIPELMEQFKLIRADKYVTLEEYNVFKKYALNYTRDYNHKLSADQLRFLSRL